jgi:hypothetical protein
MVIRGGENIYPREVGVSYTTPRRQRAKAC